MLPGTCRTPDGPQRHWGSARARDEIPFRRPANPIHTATAAELGVRAPPDCRVRVPTLFSGRRALRGRSLAVNGTPRSPRVADKRRLIVRKLVRTVGRD